MRLGEERAEGYLPGISNGQPETKVQEEGEKAAALPFPLKCAQKLTLQGLKSSLFFSLLFCWLTEQV